MNQLFSVSSLTWFFDFVEPWLRVKIGSMIFENCLSSVQTGSLIVENDQ